MHISQFKRNCCIIRQIQCHIEIDTHTAARAFTIMIETKHKRQEYKRSKEHTAQIERERENI